MRVVQIALLLVSLFFSIESIAGLSEIKGSNNQLGFQAMITNMDYLETGNGILGAKGAKLDSETGNVSGNSMFFSRMWGSKNNYFAAQYSSSSGYTKYVGALISGGTYGSIVSRSSATLTDYSARLGLGFVAAVSRDEIMLTPHVELGHHEWYRGVNRGEDYTHQYVGLGVLLQYSPVQSSLVYSARGLIGMTFGSYIDVTGVFAGPLGNSSLYMAGLSVDYAFTKIIHLNLGAEYLSFSYGSSELYPYAGGYVGEPESTSTYLIYKAGMGISF